MTLVELLARVLGAFETHELELMLIGGMAVSMWVEPRLTRDCDIVVRVRKRDRDRLESALIECGARVTQLEMRLLFERRWLRMPMSEGPRLDVHLCLSEHDRAAFENARPMSWGERRVRVATPEDLILFKLQAWRHQDRSDIEALRSLDDLDVRYIESWLPRVEQDCGAPVAARWAEVSGD